MRFAGCSTTGTIAGITTALRDRLGSTIDTIDNGVPSLGTARSYDAFGAVRNGDLSNRVGGTLNLADTHHGFTQHEHADDVRLIHMGGRIYDYSLGRFLNVDPVIGNPLSSQSLNPYSYIGNNPLSGKDPTGYAACTTGTNIGGDSGPSCDDLGVGVTQVATPSASQLKAAASAGSNGVVIQGAQKQGGTDTSSADVQKLNSANTAQSGVPANNAPAPAPTSATTGVVPLDVINVRPMADLIPEVPPSLPVFLEFVATRLIPPFLLFTPTNIGQHCAADGCGCGSICTQPVTTPGYGDTEGLRRHTTMTSDNTVIDDKIRGQLGDRGWTEQDVHDITKTSPAGTSTDNTRGRNDSATVYGGKNGYVVVNDRTGEVIQVSNRKPGSGWNPDSRIKWKGEN